MKTPAIVRRHPELRWLASALVLGGVVALVITSVSGGFRTDSRLPATNPAQLTAQVQKPHAGGYSGTILTRADLDLPERLRIALDEEISIGGDLLAGSHTMRYWYGGPDKQRVAVLDQNAEQDVFRNGSQVLTWDTRTRVAQRGSYQADSVETLPLSLAAPSELTPPELAVRLLELAGTSTETSLRSGTPVAGRQTYELVIRPSDAGTRVSAVHIEIDGEQAIPVGVQIYTADSQNPALDVSFHDLNFAKPLDRNFTFTPPEDASIVNGTDPGLFAGEFDDVRVIGSGWTTVTSYQTTPAQAGRLAAVLGGSLTSVKGSWGKGQLLDTPLLCALLTSKGQLLAGPVEPSVLYAAAGR